jgi:HTH-type transcriptional regulator / antitoxin HipB
VSTSQRFQIRSPQDLARTLSEARLARDMTQNDVAEKTGIDRTYLSRMENGFDTIQLERAFQVFRALGVRLEASMELSDE